MNYVARLAATAGMALAVGGGVLGGVAEAAPPAPVTNFSAEVDEFVVVVASWTDSPDTDTARLCYREGTTPPASPTDSGVTCQAPTSSDTASFQGSADTTYAVSVFAVNTATSEVSAAQSTTVTTSHYPPMTATGLHTTAIDSHQLRLHWSGDDSDGDIPAGATVSWVITIVRGTEPAPADAAPTAVIPASLISASYVATGLQARQPYTFTVQGKNAQDELSTARSWTAGTRVLGLRVRDTAARGATVLPATRDRDVRAAVDITGGHTRVAFTNARHTRVYFAHRGVTSGWSTPVLLGSDSVAVSAPRIAASPRGAVAVAWSDANSALVVRTKSAGSSTWHAAQKFARGSAGSGIRGLAMDRHGKLHVITGTGSGAIRYRTNASGSWTSQLVPDSASDFARVALALDPVTDRIFVVDAHNSTTHEETDGDGGYVYATQLVRVARATVTSSKLGAWNNWATYDAAATPRNQVVDIMPTVTANDGVITVGLSAKAGFDTGVGGPAAGAFVMHGTSVASHGAPSRVAGSDAYATGLIVKASSAEKVALIWSSTSPTWDPTAQGVFAERTRRGTGGWTFGTAQHVDTSHYGYPLATAYGWGAHQFASFAETNQDGPGA